MPGDADCLCSARDRVVGVVRRQFRAAGQFWRRLNPPRLTSWIAPSLALPMLALTLLPGQVWHAPSADQVYRGFDRNLITTSGSVQITPELVDIEAAANSTATANLATTLRRTLDASVDTTILANEGA